jgi:hypothetical protein
MCYENIRIFHLSIKLIRIWYLVDGEGISSMVNVTGKKTSMLEHEHSVVA